MYFDDIAADEIVIFTKDGGVSLNKKKDRFCIFWKLSGKWESETFNVGSLRDVRSLEVTPSEFYSEFNPGGVRGIGQSVGLAMRNSMEKARAKKATGIEFSLRSVELPKYFLNVVDANVRASAVEAFRQVFEGDEITSPLRVIPESTRIELKRPTAEELRQSEQRNDPVYQKEKRKRQRLTAILIIACLAVGGGGWIFYKDYQGAREGSARYYASTLASSPQELGTQVGRLCDRLHTGYERLLEREGSDVTHVAKETIRMPVIDGSRPESVYQGMTVVISELEGTFQVTRNSQRYVNAPRRDFGQNLPLPEDMSVFQPVLEPTCS